MHIKNHNQQRGFGILEVVVTLFIIGVTLLLFAIVSNAVVLNKYNRYKEVALRVAEHELQALRTTPYASLPSSGSLVNSQLGTLPQGSASLDISEIGTGLSQATVTVSWRNPTASGTQQISLSTYLWQGGLGK